MAAVSLTACRQSSREVEQTEFHRHRTRQASSLFSHAFHISQGAMIQEAMQPA